MADLLAVIRCFERPDVQELRLQSDTVITVLLPQGPTPLTKSTLNNEQLLALIAGTPVEDLVKGLKSTDEAVHQVTIAGTQLQVALLKRQERLQIKFSRIARSVPTTVPSHAVQKVVSGNVPETLKTTPSMSTSGTSATVEKKQTADTSSVQSSPTKGAQQPQMQVAAQVVAQPDWNRAALVHMLAYARAVHASDLHVMSNAPIRIRIGGKLSAYSDVQSAQRVEDLLHPLLQDKQKEILKKSGYVDLALNITEGERVRINIGQQATGLKGCFRLIPPKIPTLEALGLPIELAKVTTYHQGLAIIAGPNGQGKTTTLAALVDLINSHAAHHIITVEDPIEFLHPIKKAVISQRQVGEHTASFARALKAALREDPDVIVIGELRDKETVEIALSAAETGHLVIATMSTRSAAKTIDRLIDMFPPADQAQVRATLAGALKIIVAQRLLPRADGNGVIAASELITGSVPLWNLIRDNKLFQLPSLQARGKGLGMIRFDTTLLELTTAGLITEEIAKSSAEVPSEFDRMLQESKKPPTPEDPAKVKSSSMSGLFLKKGT